MQGFPAVALALFLAPTVAIAQTPDPNDFVLSVAFCLGTLEGSMEGLAQWPSPPCVVPPGTPPKLAQERAQACRALEQSSKDALTTAEREEARLRTYLQLKLLTAPQVVVGISLAFARGKADGRTVTNYVMNCLHSTCANDPGFEAAARDRVKRCEAISAMVPF
jgi:hypothetical protein